MSPSDKVNEWLISHSTSELTAGLKMVELVKRPQLNILMLQEISPRLAKLIKSFPYNRRDEIVEAAEILVKYGGYILRERELAEKTMRLENIKLRSDLDYDAIKAISTEGRQKLNLHKPQTIGQASRIPGVSPADINILLMLHNR